MKKVNSLLLAIVLLFFAAAANADQINSDGASGHPGDSVSLDISLGQGGAGNFTFGGLFRISFNPQQLVLADIVGASDAFWAFYTPGPAGVARLSVANFNDPADPAFGSIFSIKFSIFNPYPVSPLPATSTVDIVWYEESLTSDQDIILSSISPVITILAPDNGTVPEPGILGLFGLSLLMLSALRRGKRTGNDRV